MTELIPPATTPGETRVIFDYPCRCEADKRGEALWYTYQPSRYLDPSAPVTSTTAFQADRGGDPPRCVRYPCFASPDEALAYMYELKICGQVQRFLITPDLAEPRKRVCLGGLDDVTVENHPWLTAGVVRCLERAEAKATGTCHAGLLNLGPDGINKDTVKYLDP